MPSLTSAAHRSAEPPTRELLWKGRKAGTIDCVVSDPSPSTLDLKDLDNGGFAVVWGGVLSLHATRTFPDLDPKPGTAAARQTRRTRPAKH